MHCDDPLLQLAMSDMASPRRPVTPEQGRRWVAHAIWRISRPLLATLFPSPSKCLGVRR